MGYLFDTDTAGERTGENEFTAHVTDRWDALNGVNGGYTTAILLNALKETMPLPDPLVVSAFFLKRVDHAPATIRTATHRVGKRIATGTASMYQEDAELARLTAQFGTLGAEGRRFSAEKAPGLPDPDDCVDPITDGPSLNISILERVEYRTAEMPGWLKGEQGDPYMEFWMRFSDGRDPDLVSLAFLVDAAPPAVLALGELSTTLQLTVHLRAHPAPGWLACRLYTRYVSGGYHEEDMELWDSNGELVAQSRQLLMLLDR